MRTTLAPVANGLNANRLAAHPEFYNAALDNCTTGIRLNVQHIGAAQPWDYRILVNGLGAQLLVAGLSAERRLDWGDSREGDQR